jgi:hypothetical protein
MWAWPNTSKNPERPCRCYSSTLTLIFQKSLDEGNIPNDWRTTNVTAIFKKGEWYKASNYRPVSLTSLCCKVQEHIIVSSILKHLDAHQILTDCQHWFRARRSCETQLLTLAHELLSSLDVGYQHDLIILDFSKAFDRVPHERFPKKLDHYGIGDSTQGWIKNKTKENLTYYDVQDHQQLNWHQSRRVPDQTNSSNKI